MSQLHLTIATAYYAAMAAKNLTEMKMYLHPNVTLIAPLGKKTGKTEVLELLAKAISMFKTVTVRDKLASDEKAAIIYDVVFPDPVGQVSAAGLLTFEDNLIVKIELFYDARKLEKAWES